MPGLSSARIPTRVRLFVALAVTLSLSPILLERFTVDLKNQQPAMTLWWILSETLTGLLIGLLGRIFFLALQTLITGIAMAIGFSSIPGTPIEETEPMSALGSLIMMVATALIFISDLQWEVLRGLIASYSRIPPGQSFGAQSALVEIVDQTTTAFVLALRISSPFIIYSIIVNLAVSLANKLTPSISVYFLATPFILAGGLLILYFIFNEFTLLFMTGFVSWLTRG